MSGSGGGGYGYQANAFAFLSAYALAEQPLKWFDDLQDVPVAVSMETGAPGDDLRVELHDGGQIEVQCKHGARFRRVLRLYWVKSKRTDLRENAFCCYVLLC
jgi:hypothetical protein